MNAMPKSQAIQHLQKVLDGIAYYAQVVDITSSLDFWRLQRSADVAVTYVFGEEGRHREELNSVLNPTLTYAAQRSDRVANETFVLCILTNLFESMIEEVNEYWTDEVQADETFETLSNELRQADFRTGDAELDKLLESARQKFLAPSEDDHRDALEKLWDAWERLKTVDVGDKKLGSQKMLDEAAGSNQPKFRDLLEREARSLTDAGNSLRIRHSETVQERLETSEHVDYLFHRMFALIHLILKTTGRVG